MSKPTLIELALIGHVKKLLSVWAKCILHHKHMVEYFTEEMGGEIKEHVLQHCSEQIKRMIAVRVLIGC